MQAINSKYNNDLKALLRADRKYCELVDANELKLDQVEYEKYHQVQYRLEQRELMQFDRILSIWDELPTREKENFNRQYLKQFGYDCMAWA